MEENSDWTLKELALEYSKLLMEVRMLKIENAELRELLDDKLSGYSSAKLAAIRSRVLVEFLKEVGAPKRRKGRPTKERLKTIDVLKDWVLAGKPPLKPWLREQILAACDFFEIKPPSKKALDDLVNKWAVRIGREAPKWKITDT